MTAVVAALRPSARGKRFTEGPNRPDHNNMQLSSVTWNGYISGLVRSEGGLNRDMVLPRDEGSLMAIRLEIGKLSGTYR